MIKRFSLILSVVICAASCADELHEGVSAPELNAGVMTKVVNTPADSQEGVLLLCLEESAADAFAAGDHSLVNEVSGKVQMKSFAPLFVIKEGKEEVARKHNLHRWFKMEFDGLDLNSAASKMAQLEAVAKIQFNKTLVPASDGKFIPYTAPAVSQMSAESLPFNDPMLADQWHYINTGSAQVSNSSYAGGDIAVKDAWNLTAGDRRIVVAIIHMVNPLNSGENVHLFPYRVRLIFSMTHRDFALSPQLTSFPKLCMQKANQKFSKF